MTDGHHVRSEAPAGPSGGRFAPGAGPTPDGGRTTAGLVALAVLAAVCLVGGLALAGGDEVAARPVGLGPQGREPQFKVECDYSHSAPDDPIVVPEQPGRSHLHDFFGNVETDAFSTTESLLDGDTTCQQKLDTAAYWSPALFDHGVKVDPDHGVAYYRPGPGVDPTTVVPYPAGLVMIGGDAAATGPQDPEVAGWRCGTSPDVTATPEPCPETAPLHARIAFPDCWDGERLDSLDHHNHVAHSDDGTCPDSHPVPIPQLIFEVVYPVTGEGRDLSLASGATWTIHADFMNAWDQEKLEREVRVCLNAGNICGVVSNRATG